MAQGRKSDPWDPIRTPVVVIQALLTRHHYPPLRNDWTVAATDPFPSLFFPSSRRLIHLPSKKDSSGIYTRALILLDPRFPSLP